MMSPRLVAVGGPAKGQVFLLAADRVFVGRAPGNQVSIPDPSVSRRHCAIEREPPGRFRIRDLNSRNGTFVRDLPVKERWLEHGDEIRLGDCMLVFLLGEAEEEAGPSAVRWRDARCDERTLIRLRREDSVYLKPEELLGSPAPAVRPARALAALLKISAALSSGGGLEALAQRLLELTAEVVPAGRGAVLLMPPGVREPAAAFCWSRGAPPAEPPWISSAFVERAFQEGVAVLSNNVAVEPVAGAPEEPPGPRVSSVLAAPLFSGDQTLGVIYLDSTDPRVCFDQEHLQLLSAVGALSGPALENARRLEWLEAENRRLHAEITLEHDMVGESPRMAEVYAFIAKAAPTDSTVLLSGESGTGKELVARAIHRNSPRAGRPFVAINCAALTETLLESELFGHEKGAFTGAIVQKKGKLEVADGGSVFLDEVGEIPLAFQSKLLRVLQEREFERVGGTRPIKVDIRLIAATNRDLRQAARQGAFRQDLYYRLNVVALTLPPLRARREDISLLASYFAVKYSKRAKRRLTGISAAARACLTEYDWPGNVRELENAIERAVVLGSADLILPEDLPEALLEAAPAASVPAGNYHEALRRQKKELVLKALEQARGNFTEAAQALGVHPNYLHRLVSNLDLRAALKKLAG
jgi:Nif-specific regulatory protein